MNETPAIRCSGLVRIYGTAGAEVQALQGLDLVVQRGELVAIVGASGSGKSTLLGILSGFDLPTAGLSEVDGIDLATLSPRKQVQFRRHTVGFIWQQTSRNLLPYLSIAENIATVASLSRTSRSEQARRIADVTSLLALGEIRDLRPAWLSGAQQQRAAIAVALVNQPSVLLADEPTGELDDEASQEVLAAIRSVNEERQITTVIVTHDPSVSEHVRRTVRIRDGRTSTETLRNAEMASVKGESNSEEFAVLDRFGRLQLPEEFTDSLGLRERVRLALKQDHIRLEPGDQAKRPAASESERPRSGRHAGRKETP